MVTHSDNMLEKQLIYPVLDTSSTSRIKKKPIKPEDPMSHRIIEKRRRDRMNNCLADLSRLIPADYLKKGRGRIEKTEIIEMAIKHMRHLQNIIATTRANEVEKNNSPGRPPIVMEHYRLGYLECLSEAMHFLVEIQGFFAGDALCVQMINHLHRHCDTILLGKLNQDASHCEPTPMGGNMGYPRQHAETTSNSSSSTGAAPSPPFGMSTSIGTASSPPLGMSNSTNGNSDENPDYTYLSENDEPAFVRRSFSSSSGVGSIIIKEETEGPSQLRDMLINNSRKSVSSGHESAGSMEEHHMYKFKNTIQQRYNESQHHEIIDDDEEPACKKVKKEESLIMTNGRLSFGHKGLNKVQNLEPSSQNQQQSDVKPSSIPVFALHENGSYYIPLTLDQHMLSQHLPTLTSKPMHKTALHPVTISVNFQKPNQN